MRLFGAAVAALLLLAGICSARADPPPVTASPAPWLSVGSTVTLSPTTSSVRAQMGWATVSPIPSPPPSIAYVCNWGSDNGYVKMGDSSVTATNSDTPILAGACQALAVAGNTYVAAISASTSTTIKVQNGNGWPMAGGTGSGGGTGTFMLTTASNAQLPTARDNLVSGLTTGTVFFKSSTGWGTDATNLLWDNTIKSLQIGPATTALWAGLNIAETYLAPTTVQSSITVVPRCLGDNTTFIGCSGVYAEVHDAPGITGSNKGVLYGFHANIVPSVSRNNSPWDDAAGFIIGNGTTNSSTGTDALFFAHNDLFTGGAPEWTGGLIVSGANASVGLKIGGAISTYGINFALSTLGNGLIIAPNNKPIVDFVQADGLANRTALSTDTSNNILMGITGAQGAAVTMASNSNAFPTQTIYRSQSGASFGAGIEFDLNNASSARVNYASLAATIAANTAGAHDGKMEFLIANAGTVATRATIDKTGAYSGSTATFSALASDATHTDSSVCADASSGLLYKGSGAAGICLGTSSLRFKHDVRPLNDGLAAVMAIEPIVYRYNAGHGDPNKDLYGFAAEQLVGVLPDLVGKDAEGRPNSVDWAGVVPVLVKAIQEQQREIVQLRTRSAQ